MEALLKEIAAEEEDSQSSLAGNVAGSRGCFQVSQAAYNKAIAEWLDAPPAVCLRLKLGPQLFLDSRNVSMGGIKQCFSVVEGLLASGLGNGVLQPRRLEAALVDGLASRPHVLGTWSLAEACKATKKHLQAIMQLLRYYKQEDESSISDFSRYPRTGSFRRHLQYKDLVVVRSLAERLESSPPQQSRESRLDSTQGEMDYRDVFGLNEPKSGGTASGVGKLYNIKQEVKTEGFHGIKREPVEDSGVENSSSHDVQLTTDGYPAIFKFAKQHRNSEDSPPLADEGASQVHPNPRKRKEAVMAQRAKESSNPKSK